ncbi:MAG: hypothetical protein L3J08_08865, partial [Flavobacteriaceae bacterium]|nr:hypothetical protein [Flavobacteriaceae bacterium]
MKNIFKFNMLFIIIWFNYSFVFGHSERVHQYIAREGYELMKLHIGYDVPEMLAHLGTSETNGYVDWFTRGNDNFESGKIVCGAFREDVSDIVWGYGKEGFPGMSQGLQYALASVTHFWDADLGDDYPNNFASFYTPDIPYSDIPNAFQKITTYYSDNWLLFPDGLLVTDAYGDQVKLYNEAGGSVSFHYDNLVEFYKTGLIQAGLSVAVNTSNGEEKGWIYGSHFNVDENYRARIAFEILGRMAHLLGN